MYRFFQKLREHRFELNSITLTPDHLTVYDLVLLATDHDAFDYPMIQKYARLIVDTRGVFLEARPNVVRA